MFQHRGKGATTNHVGPVSVWRVPGFDVCIVRSVIAHVEVYQAVGDGMLSRRILCYLFRDCPWSDAYAAFGLAWWPGRMHARASILGRTTLSAGRGFKLRPVLLWLFVWGTGPLVFAAGAVLIRMVCRRVWGIRLGWMAAASLSVLAVSAPCLSLLWLLCRGDVKGRER